MIHTREVTGSSPVSPIRTMQQDGQKPSSDKGLQQDQTDDELAIGAYPAVDPSVVAELTRLYRRVIAERSRGVDTP